ncbi:UNVERIFIED_CONTAM: hypothetical protein Sindi_2931300 [Sesamum indicum]
MGGGAWPFLVGGAICLVNSVNERDLSLLPSYAEVCDALRCSGPHARYTDVFNESIALAERPGKRESSARVDYVPALCTHRPSFLPIEWSGEVFRSRRRGRFAARDVNLRKDHCQNLQKQTANTLQTKSGPGRGANAPVRSPLPLARANPLDVRANEPPARHASRKTERSVRRTVAPSAGCTGGGDVSRMSKRLSTMDISALASMKNVEKCDTWCELQNPVNHRVFQRKLRPKPLGQGTSAWASRIAWGADISLPCASARGWPKCDRASGRNALDLFSKWAIFGKQNWRCGMNRKPGYGAQLRANLDPTKGVGRLRQQDGGHGRRNPLRSVTYTQPSGQGPGPDE